MKVSKFLFSACVAAALVGCAPKDETEKKIDQLLGQMTLHEKVGQMNQLSGGAWLVESAAKGEVGSILNCVDPAEINAVQRAAVEQSRLGIPILVSRDVIHGFRTMFPIPIGPASAGLSPRCWISPAIPGGAGWRKAPVKIHTWTH